MSSSTPSVGGSVTRSSAARMAAEAELGISSVSTSPVVSLVNPLLNFISRLPNELLLIIYQFVKRDDSLVAFERQRTRMTLMTMDRRLGVLFSSDGFYAIKSTKHLEGLLSLFKRDDARATAVRELNIDLKMEGSAPEQGKILAQIVDLVPNLVTFKLRTERDLHGTTGRSSDTYLGTPLHISLLGLRRLCEFELGQTFSVLGRTRYQSSATVAIFELINSWPAIESVMLPRIKDWEGTEDTMDASRSRASLKHLSMTVTDYKVKGSQLVNAYAPTLETFVVTMPWINGGIPTLENITSTLTALSPSKLTTFGFVLGSPSIANNSTFLEKFITSFVNLRHLSLGIVGYTDLSFLSSDPSLESFSIYLDHIKEDFWSVMRLRDLRARLEGGLGLKEVRVYGTGSGQDESMSCGGVREVCERLGIRFVCESYSP